MKNNEKRYYFTDEIGQQSTRLVGLITYHGSYLTYAQLMHQIASKFNICLGQTEQDVFYVDSQKDYEQILKELDRMLK